MRRSRRTCDWISARRMPRIAPFNKMFSRPVSSGWKPVPTSSRLPTLPRISARPAVGSVIRERIFSSVLFPAPFRPMIPTTSPRRTSKDTSRRAQIEVSGVPFRKLRMRRMGAPSAPIIASRRVRCRTWLAPIRYTFDKPSTRIATSVARSDVICGRPAGSRRGTGSAPIRGALRKILPARSWPPPGPSLPPHPD